MTHTALADEAFAQDAVQREVPESAVVLCHARRLLLPWRR